MEKHKWKILRVYIKVIFSQTILDLTENTIS